MISKKILAGFAVVCVSAVAGYGVSKSLNNDVEMEVLRLHNVEALGQAEWGGWDNFWQGQGFWKDEREEKRPCGSTSVSGEISGSHNGTSGSASGSSTEISPDGRFEIICPYGSKNCTSVGC